MSLPGVSGTTVAENIPKEIVHYAATKSSLLADLVIDLLSRCERLGQPPSSLFRFQNKSAFLLDISPTGGIMGGHIASPKLNREPLHFETVHLTQRSYK